MYVCSSLTMIFMCVVMYIYRCRSATLKCSPANPALQGLNVGGGVEIKLRLRRPNSDWVFYPYEQILDTMLHELCHNEHGPHNADFYRLLDEIRRVIILIPLSWCFSLFSCFLLMFCL